MQQLLSTVQALSVRTGVEKDRNDPRRGGSGAGDRIELSSNRKFSDPQFRRLRSIIGTDDDNSSNVPSGNDFLLMKYDWIIDTGASMHMIGYANLLTNSRPNKDSSPVHIPNGKSIQSTRIGEANLGGGFYLNNVLLAPGFNCNLISVVKLVDDLNCGVTSFTYSLMTMMSRDSLQKLSISGCHTQHFLFGYCKHVSSICFQLPFP